MFRRSVRQPRFAIDDRGEQIALVLLPNDDRAVRVDRDMFDNLVALGISTQWTLNRNKADGIGYVRCCVIGEGRKLFTVARLIMRPGPGEVVKYRSGDRTDLRRSNLYLCGGKAKGRELELMDAREGPRNESPWMSWGIEPKAIETSRTPA